MDWIGLVVNCCDFVEDLGLGPFVGYAMLYFVIVKELTMLVKEFGRVDVDGSVD